jgi:hypothetical protein
VDEWMCAVVAGIAASCEVLFFLVDSTAYV